MLHPIKHLCLVNPMASSHAKRMGCIGATWMFILVTFTGCDPQGNSSQTSFFDREAFLSHVGDSIILPAYVDFEHQAWALHEMVSSFEDGNCTTQAIEASREQLKATYEAWQHVALYDFGPALERGLFKSTNTFPTNSDLIEGAVGDGTWTPGIPDTQDHIGLPALDYMFNHTFAEELSASINSQPERVEHLLRLTSHLHSQAWDVLAAWESSYLDVFKASTGTEMGSSMGELLNAFNRVFENHIRQQKLGLPCGISTFSQTPLPGLVEAPFAKNWSIDLMLEAMTALETLYFGDPHHGTTDAIGLDDYLVSLGDVSYGQDLHDEISSRLQTSMQAVATMEDPLAQFVVERQADAFAVYTELQALVVLWKVDMMSALGVLITYQDNDGD